MYFWIIPNIFVHGESSRVINNLQPKISFNLIKNTGAVSSAGVSRETNEVV